MRSQRVNERLYPEAVDCTWLASDREGHIGAFVTGGIAPIPIVLLDLEAPEVEDLEAMLLGLAKTSTARLLISLEHPDSFIEMAERGIFVYDWRDVHRSAKESVNAYEAIATPTIPIKLESLPDALGTISTLVKFEEVAFSDGTPLRVCSYISCREGGC